MGALDRVEQYLLASIAAVLGASLAFALGPDWTLAFACGATPLVLAGLAPAANGPIRHPHQTMAAVLAAVVLVSPAVWVWWMAPDGQRLPFMLSLVGFGLGALLYRRSLSCG
jgi:hypothetical protein